MKVMHLLQSSHFSGAENVVCQIISMTRNIEGIEMIYCSTEGTIEDALKERNISFFPLHTFTIKNIKSAISKIKPDIIHAHDMNATFKASLVCGNIPLISHIHNNAFDSRKVNLKSLAFYFSTKKVKHIFWVSKSAYESYFFSKQIEDKSSILYNILDEEQLMRRVSLDENNYDFDVIFLGRITAVKDPYRMLKIFDLLVKNKKDIKIAVVGTGDMLEEIELKSKEYGLEKNVIFMGFQSNPSKMLFNSKIMIMTSLWEGTPMCALEAMSLGVPIVSTPVDGLKDIVENGVNGYLFDDNKLLSDSILEILINDDIRKLFSKAQIEKAHKWNDKKRYIDTLINVYRG